MQESRPMIPVGLGILKGSLVTWDIPEPFAVSGSHNFSFVNQGIHLVLQVMNLSQKPIHGGRILFVLHGEFIIFQLCGSVRFLTTNSLLFLNLLAIFCDLLGRFCFSNQVPHFVLQILNLSQELTHSGRIPPVLLQRQFFNPQLSGAVCFSATDPS